MKIIEWEKCVKYGSMGTYPPKDGKMLMPNDPVEPELHVEARYKGSPVHLKIKEKITPITFKAIVLRIDDDEDLSPNDLSENDEVLIDRDHICFLFDRE